MKGPLQLLHAADPFVDLKVSAGHVLQFPPSAPVKPASHMHVVHTEVLLLPVPVQFTALPGTDDEFPAQIVQFVAPCTENLPARQG